MQCGEALGLFMIIIIPHVELVLGAIDTLSEVTLFLHVYTS